MFLYSTVSTLKPMVGMVVTISPSLSLYKMAARGGASKRFEGQRHVDSLSLNLMLCYSLVLPAASKPTIRIPKRRKQRQRVEEVVRT